jgi:thioredoxin reductase/NAD-dependent dihydropyrimidine dehydrogenase PreA subunit
VSWITWLTPSLVVSIGVAALIRRRALLRDYARVIAERQKAKAQGSHEARLLHPHIDLQKCIGCGGCVRECPESGVLDLAFGQAVVVHGARCVGHGRCADACPTGAIALTLGDLSERKDLPAIDEKHEAVTVPGLFLAGEITGFSLVRTAVQHGALVAAEVAHRVGASVPVQQVRTSRNKRVATFANGSDEAVAVADEEPTGPVPLDLLIVGMGPAGLSCALAAKQHGLRFACVDQAETIGGTVAAYPRKKLVMTQPMELPLHGKLNRLEYAKEELVELWQGLTKRHRLPVKLGVQVTGLTRGDDEVFTVATSLGNVRARHVVLAVGRRGSPQKLEVPGEELPKVSYSLLDAESYQGRNLLVVGGGDSAIEAAIALGEQPGNVVTLSYRKPAFSRIKSRNETRIQEAIRDGKVTVVFESNVVRIEPDAVVLRCTEDAGEIERSLPNDEVFIFAGGKPPFPLLEAAGVSFDPTLRPVEAPAIDRGNGLLAAMVATLLGCIGLLVARVAWGSYYDLPIADRDISDWHAVLRPQGAFGLFAGFCAAGFFGINLLYLARRSPKWGRWMPGSLKAWMTMHVATGFFALLFGCLHSAFHVRDAVAGHALIVMAIVVTTGAVGRWFYSFVPKAQSGKQADLEDLGLRVAAMAGEWDAIGRGFGARVRTQVESLASAEHFGKNVIDRIFSLVAGQLRLA